MSRLTKRVIDEVFLCDAESSICKEICESMDNFDHPCEVCQINEALKKLAHYEDLEEQGRLIELPIPLGKPYYEITESCVINMFPLRPASAGRIIQNGLFGRTVFATKEEAEAKLAELKGETNA